MQGALGDCAPGSELAAVHGEYARSRQSVRREERLARAMNARLVFSNRPDEGTTVRLRLPAAARPGSEPA